MHIHSVKDLVCDDLSREPGGAEGEQVAWLAVDGILLVANLEDGRPVTGVGLSNGVIRANHVVDVEWLGFQLL